MKSTSSFSLGITQLDEQTSMEKLGLESEMPNLDNNYPSVNFILSDFDYKDIFVKIGSSIAMILS